MPMIQVSLAGFAVGGAFLNLLHFDLTYYMVALVILADVTVSERIRETEKTGTSQPMRRAAPGWSR
jgi:hypothetical protein